MRIFRRGPRPPLAAPAAIIPALLGLAILLAGCQTTPAARPIPPGIGGAVTLQPLDYRPRSGPPPAGYGRDVPAAIGAALAQALHEAGIGLDGRHCRLSGTVRDFAVQDGLWRVDVRYVLAVGGSVMFDQAIGTWYAPEGAGPATAEAAIAKNLAVLVADDWFRTLVSRDCPRPA